MYRILAYVVTIREDLWTRLPEMGKIEKYPDNDNQDGNRVRGRFGHRSSSKKSNSQDSHFHNANKAGRLLRPISYKKLEITEIRTTSWKLLKPEPQVGNY